MDDQGYRLLFANVIEPNRRHNERLMSQIPAETLAAFANVEVPDFEAAVRNIKPGDFRPS